MDNPQHKPHQYHGQLSDFHKLRLFHIEDIFEAGYNVILTKDVTLTTMKDPIVPLSVVHIVLSSYYQLTTHCLCSYHQCCYLQCFDAVGWPSGRAYGL